jgi:putative FmdB family regulatory protein
MPIYEYECGSCSHRFEKRQGFDSEPKAICPKCKGKARRIIRSAPVIFKGKGFYVTDHRPSHENHKESEKGETKEKPSAGKSESKGEPPADKSESKGEPPAGKSKSESASAKS